MKYYVILYNDDVMIYGIKARISPYGQIENIYDGGQLSPFGGGPNWLPASGGAPRRRETAEETLKRETYEETAHTYQLRDGGVPFHDGSYVNDGGWRIPCQFFRSNNFECIDPQWPSDVQREAMGPDAGEMCWVAAAPKSEFDCTMTGQDVAMKMLSIAKAQAQWQLEISSQIASVPNKAYMDSVFCPAFAIFVRRWLNC